jgi:hypothetical protein
LKTVGVFDSGVGGLSVLRALLAELPGVRFIYVADSAYAPYGERTVGEITDRSERITSTLWWSPATPPRPWPSTVCAPPTPTCPSWAWSLRSSLPRR